MREEKKEISKENFYVTTAIKNRRLAQSGLEIGEAFCISREIEKTPHTALKTIELFIVPKVLNKLFGISAKIKKHEKEMQRI